MKTQLTATQEKQIIKAGVRILKKNKHQLEFLVQFGNAKESVKLMNKIVKAHFPSMSIDVRDEMVFQFIEKHMFSI